MQYARTAFSLCMYRTSALEPNSTRPGIMRAKHFPRTVRGHLFRHLNSQIPDCKFQNFNESSRSRALANRLNYLAISPSVCPWFCSHFRARWLLSFVYNGLQSFHTSRQVLSIFHLRLQSMFGFRSRISVQLDMNCPTTHLHIFLLKIS